MVQYLCRERVRKSDPVMGEEGRVRRNTCAVRLRSSSVAAQGLNQSLIVVSLIGRLVGGMRLLTLLIRN